MKRRREKKWRNAKDVGMAMAGRARKTSVAVQLVIKRRRYRAGQRPTTRRFEVEQKSECRTGDARRGGTRVEEAARERRRALANDGTMRVAAKNAVRRAAPGLERETHEQRRAESFLLGSTGYRTR